MRIFLLAGFAMLAGARTSLAGVSEILDYFDRTGRIVAIEGEDAGDRALRLRYEEWTGFPRVDGAPQARLEFIGTSESGSFEPKQVKLCEIRQEEYDARRDGRDELSEKDGPGDLRCYYANLGGGLERVKVDVDRREIRRNWLGPADETARTRAREVFEEGRIALGVESFKDVLAQIQEDMPMQAGKVLYVHAVPRPDGRFKEFTFLNEPADEFETLGKYVFRLKIGLRRTPSGSDEEEWVYTSELDGTPMALEHWRRAKLQRDGTPEREDRLQFAALLSSFDQHVRRLIFDENLRSGH